MSMRSASIASVAALTLVVLSATADRAHASCDNVECSELKDQDILDRFGGAVLRIDSADNDVGTGFLIDSMRGYVLTAGHVVSLKPRDNGLKVVATTPGGVKLNLVLVKD